MNDKQLLMIPGPTPVPTRVLHALSNPALGHRTPGFSAKIKECTAKVKPDLKCYAVKWHFRSGDI